MLDVSIKVKTNFSDREIISQSKFALAKSLTMTAKHAQEEIVKANEASFTIRNQWLTKGPYAIKVKPATKSNLRSEVGTNADWLLPHEEGKNKTPHGNYIAIPTSNVRRNKKQIIVKGQRPKNLPRSFIILSSKKKIPIIFQRRGKGKKSDITAMYILEPLAKIKKMSTILEPSQRIYQRNFNQNFAKCFTQALLTAKAKPAK